MFRQIVVSGDARERGVRHGEMLCTEIAAAVEFYAGVFNLPQPELFAQVEYYRDKIRDFSPEYAVEIEGIAAGARIDPLWIYALNSRTELIALIRADVVSECTALYFAPAAILGENWDWAQSLEELACLLRIDHQDHWIYMLTEPGIIGKVGMNSCGVGVCLNFLRVDKPLTGVPIHIVLRAILDSRSVEDALAVVDRAGVGKAGNILIGDAAGNCYNVEYAGDESFLVAPSDGVLIHTNHYLGRDINPDAGRFRSSFARMRVATSEAAQLDRHSVAGMNTILSNRAHPELPIYRPYEADSELGDMGTVCTIIMDLPNRQFHIRKGNAEDGELVLVYDGAVSHAPLSAAS